MPSTSSPRILAPLAKSAVLLAWFAIVNGILTIATPGLLPLLFGATVPPSVTVLFLALGITSLAGGFYGLRANVWAFWLLFCLFLIQCVEYQSENLLISLIGPLSLKFGFGWYAAGVWIKFNILAIVICVLSSRAAIQLTPMVEENDSAGAI